MLAQLVVTILVKMMKLSKQIMLKVKHTYTGLRDMIQA
jgi:hypothetical protein